MWDYLFDPNPNKLFILGELFTYGSICISLKILSMCVAKYSSVPSTMHGQAYLHIQGKKLPYSPLYFEKHPGIGNIYADIVRWTMQWSHGLHALLHRGAFCGLWAPVHNTDENTGKFDKSKGLLKFYNQEVGSVAQFDKFLLGLFLCLLYIQPFQFSQTKKKPFNLVRCILMHFAFHLLQRGSFILKPADIRRHKPSHITI